MAQITYIARRSLGTGHSVGIEYTIDLELMSADRTVKHLKEKQEALSGLVETCYHGTIGIWDVRFLPVAYEDAEYILEMLDSTADGQQFEFDPYGDLAVPVRAMVVIREDDGYTEERAVEVGDWELDHFIFGFQLREV